MSAPIHLHVHSWYSLLEAASSPEALLDRAAAYGYSTLALTDTNNLYGAMAFSEAAAKQGIRPMIGACLRQNRSRCVALIADASGYRSLCRIISGLNLGEAKAHGWPPVGVEQLLNENSDGLHLLVDDEGLAERLRGAFGPRLWIEIIRPPQSPLHEQRLLECARRLGLPLIASTAVHFATPDEYHAFRLATAVRRIMLLEQLPRRLTIAPEHHLVDADTFRRRFHDLPEALRNTQLLAEQLRSSVLPCEVILPPPRVPRSLDANRYLEALCERGLRRREIGDSLAARQRLREELAVISATNLAGYFLIVRDIALYARRKNHSMALRGSAGNSLVCYLLEITDVDPLRFDLPLERFLHPGRSDLPDIDLDFDWKVRDDVIDYVFRRHGEKHTARISSHLFLQPRSAFRESGKVHGLSNQQISALLETLDARVSRIVEEDTPPSSFPPQPAAQARAALACAAGWGAPPRSFPLEPERWPAIVRDARVLLGRPHHLSIHPGGVVITPGPIENHAPLQWAPKGVVMTQFDKDSVEYVGLVKIDLLGNRALATVDEALEWLRGTGHGAALHRCDTDAHGLKHQCSSPPHPCKSVRYPCSAAPWPILLDDRLDTLQILQAGDTLGVNQLESPAMRHLLIEMQPTCVDDVIQSLALIRPGAASIGAKECFIRRRHGLDSVRVAHASLEPILRETMGLMVYEDDGLSVIQALTGLPGPDADRFRKRVSKHRTEVEALELTKEFLVACDRNGIPRPAAEEMWVQLAKFNNYSFCKSHAVSYGLIAWKAVTLKARYPLAFWTAALNNNQGMYPRRVYIEAIKRAGIPLRLPCVNRSRGPFSVDDGAIRTGLEAIASLDEALRDKILLERDRDGPYQCLTDFRRRVLPGPEALALLIRSGALDFTRRPRPALFLEADLQDQIRPGDELFANDLAENWSPSDYGTVRRFRDEFELLGFITGPPLMSLFRPRVPDGQICSRDLAANIGKRVRLSGLVATARHTPTSDGRDMQFVTLEDEWGLIEVTLFPGTCEPVAYLAMGPYTATGRVEEKYGVVTLTAEKFERDD
jgi:DNA-directed DNA polymerase III PolC